MIKTKEDRKAQIPINPLILVTVLLVIVAATAVSATLKDNGNGAINWFHDDVTSRTDRTPDCEPKKYLAELTGTLDIFNDYISLSEGYQVHYLDAHINDIDISREQLGLFTKDYDAEVCLYDSWNNHKEIDCKRFEGKVVKGQIKRIPFEFKYNIYDNNCDGQVDDHGLQMVVKLRTENNIETYKKGISISGGEAVFQNVLDEGERYNP